MLPFSNPVPRTTNINPKKKVCSRGIAKVKCPIAMIIAPINTAF